MSIRSQGEPSALAAPDDAPVSMQTDEPKLEQQDAAPPAPAEPPPKYVSHLHTRINETDGSNHVYFWVVEEQGKVVLAVVGTDPRGTGHFTYVNTPDMDRVASPLRSTNRTGVMAWLAEIGAGTLEISIPIPEVDTAMVPRTSALLPRSKPAKRRVTEGGEGPAGPRRRMGHGKGGQDENGISIEVQEAYKPYPELFQWVTAQPDEAIRQAFSQYTQELSCTVSDEAPAHVGVREDGSAMAWIPTSTCVRILDEITACDQVSLRLLQVTDIAGAVARLRQHVSVDISKRAEVITANWRAAANATLQRANEFMAASNAGAR